LNAIIDTMTGKYLLKHFIDNVAPWVSLEILLLFAFQKKRLLAHSSSTCATQRHLMKSRSPLYHPNTTHFVQLCLH
jgi:hypothetical protein